MASGKLVFVKSLSWLDSRDPALRRVCGTGKLHAKAEYRGKRQCLNSAQVEEGKDSL